MERMDPLIAALRCVVAESRTEVVGELEEDCCRWMWGHSHGKKEGKLAAESTEGGVCVVDDVQREKKD